MVSPTLGDLFTFLGVIACLAMPSFWLVRRGARGRRTGDHPYCSKCGFDLFGRPTDSMRCSECGASLNAKRAIVIGQRTRRPIMLVFGIVMLVITTIIGATGGVEIYKKIDWLKARPDWWLAMEFDPAINPTGNLPLPWTGSIERELHERLSPDNNLSGRAIRIMARRLSNRIDNNQPVNDKWTGFVLERTPQVWLADSHFRTLIRTNIHPRLRLDDSVVHGDPILFGGSTGWPFGWNTNGDSSTQITTKVVFDQVNGIDVGSEHFRTVDFRSHRSIQTLNYLDLKMLWAQIGFTSDERKVELDWQRDVEITIELRSGRRVFTERWVERVSAKAKVLDPSHSMAAVAPANAFDRALVWCAKLHVSGEDAWIELNNGDDPSPNPIHVVMARVVLIGDGRETDTGVCWDSSKTQTFRASDIPAGTLRIELRPALELRWMFTPNSPILGEVIHIEKMERVEDSSEEVVRFNTSMF